MEDLIKIIVLAVVQGITEFLPVSSSGHLAVISKIVHLEDAETVGVAVCLHAGTLLAIVVYYFRTLLLFFRKDRLRLMLQIVIATVPAGIFGVIIKKTGLDEKLFNNLFFVGGGFIVTGSMLFFLAREKASTWAMNDITLKNSILVGLAQAVAVIPGISRSGSTISAAVKTGMDKNDAATFSFLLAIPAIGGAAFLELLLAILKTDEANQFQYNIFNMAVGFVISAVVGYIALSFLIKTLRKGGLKYYAFYCFTLSAVVITWAFVKLFQ